MINLSSYLIALYLHHLYCKLSAGIAGHKRADIINKAIDTGYGTDLHFSEKPAARCNCSDKTG